MTTKDQKDRFIAEKQNANDRSEWATMVVIIEPLTGRMEYG